MKEEGGETHLVLFRESLESRVGEDLGSARKGHMGERVGRAELRREGGERRMKASTSEEVHRRQRLNLLRPVRNEDQDPLLAVLLRDRVERLLGALGEGARRTLDRRRAGDPTTQRLVLEGYSAPLAGVNETLTDLDLLLALRKREGRTRRRNAVLLVSC